MNRLTDDEREAGRALDALIAERVMGRRAVAHTSRPITHGKSYDGYWSESWMDGEVRIVSEMPRYSTDIGAAWQVVEHMTHNDVRCELATYLVNEGYSAEFSGRPWKPTFAETMPLAICRAALRWTDEYGAITGDKVTS